MNVALSVDAVLQYVLIATRITSAMMVMPFFGLRLMPPIARIGLGLMTALVLAPVAPSASNLPTDGTFFTLIAWEILLGIAAGFAIMLIFAGIQIAAGLLDLQVGFSLASAFDPAFQHMETLLERYFAAFALLVFLQIDGHHWVLAGMRDLLALAPVGDATPLTGFDRLIALSSGMFITALRIALPGIAALLLVDLALGIVGRAMPQLNLLALGLPLKTAVGLLVVGYGVPFIASRLADLFRSAPFQLGWLVAQ